MTLYIAHPLVFFEESIPEYDGCIIHSNLWSSWTNNLTDVMLVKITNNEKTHYLHVHSHHNVSEDVIYIPTWCIGSETTIEVLMERVLEMPPLATKITLQPLDNELYHCDIAAAVSQHLSNWQVLSEGTTLTVPCPELDGFLVDIYVKTIEPEKTVLLRGEVPLELDEPLETVNEWIHNTSPNQERPSSPTPDSVSSFNEFIDVPIQESGPKKFVPFSGKGYSLL